MIARLERSGAARRQRVEIIRLLFPEDNPPAADNIAAQLEAKRQRELYPKTAGSA